MNEMSGTFISRRLFIGLTDHDRSSSLTLDYI